MYTIGKRRMGRSWNGLKLHENIRYFAGSLSEVEDKGEFENLGVVYGGSSVGRGFVAKFIQFDVVKDIRVDENFGGELYEKRLQLLVGDIVLCKVSL